MYILWACSVLQTALEARSAFYHINHNSSDSAIKSAQPSMMDSPVTEHHNVVYEIYDLAWSLEDRVPTLLITIKKRKLQYVLHCAWSSFPIRDRTFQTWNISLAIFDLRSLTVNLPTSLFTRTSSNLLWLQGGPMGPHPVH